MVSLKKKILLSFKPKQAGLLGRSTLKFDVSISGLNLY
jgi:hypothetical protein